MSGGRSGHPKIRLRLTGRGLGLIVLAPFVWFAGRQLGSTDFVALATALFAIVGAGVALALFAPRDVHIVRSGPLDEVRDGQTVNVIYSLTARHHGFWPVKGTADLLTRNGGTPESLAIVGVRLDRPTSVRFDALPRGLYKLGPGWVLRSDPMGLAQKMQDIPGTETLRVWPRSAPIPSPSLPGAAGSGIRAFAPQAGYEFRQLREFVSGDDRRRIHWPSSAKRGTLLVRETQDDESEHVTVVLDCRAEVYSVSEPDPGSLVRGPIRPGFELAVSVTASLVEAYIRDGLACSLVLVAPGRPKVQIDNAGSLGRALDLLAEATASDAETGVDASDLVDLLTPDRATTSVCLLFVGGGIDAGVAQGLTRARASHPNRVALFCDADETGSYPSEMLSGAQATWVRSLGGLPRALAESGTGRSAK